MTQFESDAALMKQSLDEPEVFGLIFDRHYATILAYLERRIGRGQAEDVAGETFRAAFAQRLRFEPLHDSALPWLYGVASNLLLREWRKEKRHLRALARLSLERPEDTGGLDGAEARIDAERARALVFAEATRLPRRDRTVLFLTVWEGLSYQEIALALDVPIGTVRSRLNRARKSLTHALDIGEGAILVSNEPEGSTR